MFRFVMSPASDIKQRLSSEKNDINVEMENLQKKLTYLETTYKNSRDNLEKVFASTGIS
jgi:prefoldin subunit 1